MMVLPSPELLQGQADRYGRLIRADRFLRAALDSGAVALSSYAARYDAALTRCYPLT